MGNWIDQGKKRAIKRALLDESGVCECHYCNAQLTYESMTLDHKVPRRSGGGNRRENIVPACRACNERKGDLPYKVFQRSAA